MPAVSKKQQRFFGYLLSNPEERKKRGISKKAAKDFAQDIQEVSPPGWGHTKAEKEKTKPWKPKSKIGGTAAAFKRALDDGRFKGLPGSKTKKEKTADMFKLMWSMKKKGDHPHYKPGTDKKYKKYQKESVENGKVDLTLKTGVNNVLKADSNKHERGLLTQVNKDGSYDVAYWYDKYKAYPVEVEIDGKTCAKDAKNIHIKFHPELKKEDWKPEIEVIDTKKRKKDAEKKRKEAEASLPPHLKLDVMKKAFASEEITPSPNVSRKDRTAIDKRFKGLFKKDLKGTVAGVNEMKVSRLKDNKGAASKVIDAMVSAARRDREAREKQREKKRPKAPYQMLAQEYVPENYVKDYEKLKKKIGSKEKHDKPALQEGDFKSFMASSQAAKDRLEKKIKDRKEKDAQYIDTKKKGVRFYDKRGKGRIRSGKKIYD